MDLLFSRQIGCNGPKRWYRSAPERVLMNDFTNITNGTCLQGVVQQPNRSRGIIMSGDSLALQTVDRHMAGQYRCAAANHLANATSEALPLKLACNYQSLVDYMSLTKIPETRLQLSASTKM